MAKQNQFVKKLGPIVDSNAARPLISVMIPTFNCAQYLGATLASVLQQDLGAHQMQIEVVDDCSTDNPKAVVDTLGQGRVQFYRQEKNGGHTKNFETCLQHSKGKYVHLLHGDDKVEPGFYATLLPMLEENDDVGAAFCANFVINERNEPIKQSIPVAENAGVVPNFFELSLRRQWIQTPSMVVRRLVYETIGYFDSRLTWCEDWEMWTRIAAHYKVAYSPLPLASYRVHTSSNTSRHVKSGETLRDLKRFKSIVLPLVSGDRRGYFAKHINTSVSKGAFNNARRFYEKGDKESAINQVREAIFLNSTWRSKLRLLALYLKNLF
jgi:glycosyltransferase involved in cell wall biosynthesis